jgi:hypothetical protein
MAKEEFRYYRDRRKVVHRRKESWFNAEREKVYKDNFIRVKGEDDLSIYVAPKPKPKPKTKPKAKKGSKK